MKERLRWKTISLKHGKYAQGLLRQKQGWCFLWLWCPDPETTIKIKEVDHSGLWWEGIPCDASKSKRAVESVAEFTQGKEQ